MDDTKQVVAPEFDISDFLTDTKLEAEGVWRSLGKDAKGHVRSVKLARINNDDYQSLMRKKQRANSALLEQNDDESAKLMETINKELLAFTVIKGLKVDGVEVPYTSVLGMKMLDASRDLHIKIRLLADQADAYRIQNEDSAVKE